MKITNLQGKVTLANNVEMPYFGLGTYAMKDGEEVIRSVRHALKTGYRHIDTAAMYHNENGIGKAIKESGIAREEIFITSKVWNTEQGYGETLKAVDQSLDNLGFEYLDLYLIHWPVEGKYKDTWKALEKLNRDGKIKAIGVSNFMQHHLQNLMDSAEVMPMIDQFEFHPFLVQQTLIDFCRQHRIQPEGWRPIMKGKIFDIRLLNDLGEKYGKTPVQITLRWHLQKGMVTIPKSSHKERITANADIFDFELSNLEISQIDSLDRQERLGEDPDNFHFN